MAQLEEIINKSTTSEINHHPAANPLDPVPVQVQVGVPLMVHNNGYFFDQGFANGSGFSRVNPHSLGPFWSNPYVFGAPVGSNGGSVFENSSELSSMPKLIHHYEVLTAFLFVSREHSKHPFDFGAFSVLEFHIMMNLFVAEEVR